MYKEFLVIILISTLIFLILLFFKKKTNAFPVVSLLCLLGIILGNIIYNSRHIFPACYYDTVNGHIRYGDFTENLFSYNEGFIFPDQILFPVLRNRSVTADISLNAYNSFLSMYCKSVNYRELSLSSIQQESVILEDFTFEGTFRLIGIMNYIQITDSKLLKLIESEQYPNFYINMESLKNCSELTILSDSQYNIYIMSTSYYNSLKELSYNE